MKIMVNNKEVTTNARLLSELANEMALPESGVAVAVGCNIIPQSEWSAYVLTDGISITIIKAACGG